MDERFRKCWLVGAGEVALGYFQNFHFVRVTRRAVVGCCGIAVGHEKVTRMVS